MAPVIVSVALYWSDSSLAWKDLWNALSYVYLKDLREV